jgi:hypothetical protein
MRSRFHLRRSACLALVLFASPVLGQISGDDPNVATVTFSWAKWNANPSHYSISIRPTGDTTYQSTLKSVGRTGVPYSIRFVAPASVRQSVFNTVQQLKFLDLPYPSGRLSAEKLSVKTLSFRLHDVHNQIVYHRYKNPLVQRLTELFENISKILESGRRLAVLYRTSPTKLDGEMNVLQNLHLDVLPGLPGVAPTLREIVADKKLPRKVRDHAEAVLQKASWLRAKTKRGTKAQ